jgi:hypothetical protein
VSVEDDVKAREERLTVAPDHWRKIFSDTDFVYSSKVVGELQRKRIASGQLAKTTVPSVTHHFSRLLEAKQLAVSTFTDTMSLVHPDVNSLRPERGGHGVDHLTTAAAEGRGCQLRRAPRSDWKLTFSINAYVSSELASSTSAVSRRPPYFGH